MCDCQIEVEQKLLERFKELAPEAREHKLDLKGYALIFGKKLQSKAFLPFETSALFPHKKGDFKEIKEKKSLLATFCPFCGVKYDAEVAA